MITILHINIVDFNRARDVPAGSLCFLLPLHDLDGWKPGAQTLSCPPFSIILGNLSDGLNRSLFAG
jgi:hypothetical protein